MKEVSVFNCFGREFQTRGAKNRKMLSPKVTPFRVFFAFFKCCFLETEFSFFFKIALNEIWTVFAENFENFYC